MSEGLDIVIVLDGPSAASMTTVEQAKMPVPIVAVEQERRWLAGARNRLAREASGEILLFLDDDMVPTEGLVGRHRWFHEQQTGAVLIGRWAVPDTWNRAEPGARLGAIGFAQEAPDVAGRIRESRYFSGANTSLPRQLMLATGGYDTTFVGYGEEEIEYGLRLLEGDIPIHHDPAAFAWHLQTRGVLEHCRTLTEDGRNCVRFARLHPQSVHDIFAMPPLTRVERLMRRLCVRSPFRYRVAMSALAPLAALEYHVTSGKRTRFLRWARTASSLAGMTELDPGGQYVDVWFGPPPACV